MLKGETVWMPKLITQYHFTISSRLYIYRKRAQLDPHIYAFRRRSRAQSTHVQSLHYEFDLLAVKQTQPVNKFQTICK